jgi:hypothetical protein
LHANSFEKYGRLDNVWVARQPPGFAFVSFADARDAEDACKAENNNTAGWRVEVSTGVKGAGGGRGGGRDGGGGYGGGRGGPPGGRDGGGGGRDDRGGGGRDDRYGGDRGGGDRGRDDRYPSSRDSGRDDYRSGCAPLAPLLTLVAP